MRVLIVEDNQDVADALRECLAMLGHSVEVAYNGDQGLAVAQRFSPQVVLCDIGLPGMDGYSVARELRRAPPQPGIRLFALSGYGRLEDRRLSFDAGFDQHLTKPIDPFDLETILSNL